MEQFYVMVNHFNITIGDKSSVFRYSRLHNIFQSNILRANETKCISKMRNTLDNATFDNTKRLNVTITVTSWRTPKTPKQFLVSVVFQTLLGLKVAFIKIIVIILHQRYVEHIDICCGPIQMM